MAEITAIICTYNRAHVILNTLASLERQTLAPERFQVLVVDNNSTDNTAQVVRDFAEQSRLQVRYVFETEQGVARARNRGWQEAETEFVAYIDDDARAEPDWLEQYLKAFAEVKPTPVCITGKVELDWEGGRPDWFPERFESLLARYDFGDEPQWLPANAYLVTCNVAFRKHVFEALGGFRLDLGQNGTETYWQGGEDTEMFYRLTTNNYQVYYQPTACVAHRTPKERQTREYLLWRLYVNGSSQIVAENFGKRTKKQTLLKGAWVDVRQISKLSVQYLVARARKNTSVCEESAFRLFQRAGRVRMNLRMLGVWN